MKIPFIRPSLPPTGEWCKFLGPAYESLDAHIMNRQSYVHRYAELLQPLVRQELVRMPPELGRPAYQTLPVKLGHAVQAHAALEAAAEAGLERPSAAAPHLTSLKRSRRRCCVFPSTRI